MGRHSAILQRTSSANEDKGITLSDRSSLYKCPEQQWCYEKISNNINNVSFMHVQREACSHAVQQGRLCPVGFCWTASCLSPQGAWWRHRHLLTWDPTACPWPSPPNTVARNVTAKLLPCARGGGGAGLGRRTGSAPRTAPAPPRGRVPACARGLQSEASAALSSPVVDLGIC